MALFDHHVMSLDVDWAPDWMIREAAEILVGHRVQATWFATHPSAALDWIGAQTALFEVGLHPNFLPGSSQGRTPEEVMARLRSWFPGAVSVRTHSLFQSEPLLAMMTESFGVRVDCSQFQPGVCGLRPHEIRYSASGPRLLRIPHFFQDNMHMHAEGSWSLADPGFHPPGLKVYNFHPVHLALNAPTMAPYEALKTAVPELAEATPAQAAPFRHEGAGAMTLFRDLAARLSRSGESRTMSRLAVEWRDWPLRHGGGEEAEEKRARADQPGLDGGARSEEAP